MNLKYFFLYFFLVISSLLYSQKSESLVPKDALTVFSINNINLLQDISLDELINYEFMEEIHQELFDGSTAGKSIKEAGINFDQKLNVFFGKANKCQISGFSFGIKDKKQFFTAFDDFSSLTYPNLNGIDIYSSFVNNLIIKDDIALLIRVEPDMPYVHQLTDSIWYARGLENPFEYQDSLDELILNEKIFDEEIDAQILFPDASSDPNEKNYYELMDSIISVLQNENLINILDELFIKNINLLESNPHFKSQLNHTVEAVFFLDNSQNYSSDEIWSPLFILPILNKDLKDLFSGNIILGDIFIIENKVEFDFKILYNDKLGGIYQELSDSKFDSKVIKYIPESSTAYFTLNLNLSKGYEKAFKIIMPLFEKSTDTEVAKKALTIELFNEFVNKEALFGTCKGSMFGYFNGIKKIKTKKIEFVYDENLEYIAQTAEAEEDMPIFTFGLSIERDDIPEKILKHIVKENQKVVNMGNYWRYDNAILDAAPIYLISRNSLFLITNDEDLAINNVNGYGNKSISYSKIKKAMSSNFIYSFVDMETTLNRFPLEVLGPEENQAIQSLLGKTGVIELKSNKPTNKSANMKLIYSNFEGEKAGIHLLDLINSIYVVSK